MTAKELLQLCKEELYSDDFKSACIKMSDNFDNYREYKKAIDILNDICDANLDYTVYINSIDNNTNMRIYGADKLKFINISEISDFAFEGNDALISVDLDGITKVGEYAFLGCENLTYLYNLDNIIDIDDCAFQVTRVGGNNGEINFPDGIKSIGDGAFLQCSNLKKISLPKSIESIGSFAFSKCKNLNNVYIDNDTCKIYAGAFRDCKLTNYKFPSEYNESNLFTIT